MADRAGGGGERNPPLDYIGAGIHALATAGNFLADGLHIDIEPDRFDVEYHEETDGGVVHVVLPDEERQAEASMVFDYQRFEELYEAVRTARMEARDER